ncbi:MAG: hypothetical protein WC220_11545 [Pedobacter sp.]
MNLQFTMNSFLLQGVRAFLALPVLVCCLHASAQTVQIKKVNVGLAYPISTNGTHAAADTNSFSLNLIAGVSAGETGFSFAGVSSVIKNNATGMQFAGFSNHVGKRARGMMFAGFMNSYAEADGMQFAGFSNIAKGGVKGAQFSGFLSKAADIQGAQLAGFANVARDVTGPQFAGFSNVSRKLEGSQFAGFSNKAGDVKGSQFAGFINIAKKVSGVQASGFINVADSSDYPLGIINLIRHGEKSIGLSIDENQTGMLSFRSGGKVLYGIISAGYNFRNKEEVYAFEAGIGAHFLNTPIFRMNAELSTQSLESFKSGEYFKSAVRLMPSLRPVPGLEIFGGPVFNYVHTNTSEGRKLTDKYLHTWENRRSNNFEGIYIGFNAGINLIF